MVTGSIVGPGIVPRLAAVGDVVSNSPELNTICIGSPMDFPKARKAGCAHVVSYCNTAISSAIPVPAAVPVPVSVTEAGVMEAGATEVDLCEMDLTVGQARC